MMEKDYLIKKNESMVLAELDGQIVMMSIENGEYYGFNEMATIVWGKIESGIRVSELIENLITEYSVTKEECAKDISELMEYLSSKNIVIIEE